MLYALVRRAPREVLMTATLHSLRTVLMGVPLAWAFRAAGSAMMDDASAGAT